MISTLTKTQNNENVKYLDTLFTHSTRNGFVFNIIAFENTEEHEKFYELRLGYLEDVNATPVITLYTADNYLEIAEYCNELISNASDIYVFNRLED